MAITPPANVWLPAFRGFGGFVVSQLNTGMLIDTAQLRQNLSNPDWVVFDCRHDLVDHERGRWLYAEAHVPGAHFVPFEAALAGEKTGRNGRHPLPDAIEFAAFLNCHGITPATQIVAYDDAGGQYAARLWWLARWIGLTRVGVLDGGLAKWIVENSALDNDSPRPRARGRVVARPANSLVRSAADVLQGIRSGRGLVIDARAPERYRGEVEPVDRVAGHIPNAVNRCYRQNLNSDLTFRAPGDLRREFSALLDRRGPGQVIHQCGSGVTACVNLLAMEWAGLPGSALYPGSWSEWSSDPSRPVARG
jgi:thiosulfate/3-mercaptopyruvate sulfurtransferase